MKQRAATTALITVQILSGINTPVIKAALNSMNPFVYGFVRNSVALILLGPLALYLRARRPQLPKHQWHLAVLGAFLVYVIGNACFYVGLSKTTSINASIVVLLWPIIYFLMNIEVLKERFRMRSFVGIVLAFGGTMLAVAAPLFLRHVTTHFDAAGIGILLFGITVDAAGTMVLKKSLKKIPFMDILVIGVVMCVAFYGVLSLPHLADLQALSLPMVRYSLLYAVLAMTCIGYSLNFMALRVLKSEVMSVVNYIQPLVAIVIAVIFLHEAFTPLLIVGITAVFIGLYLVEAQRLRHHHFHSGHH